MYRLSVQAACDYVRKVMDELVSVEDIGLLASPDALDLSRLVEGFIAEAVIRTHNAAPSYLLAGMEGVIDDDYYIRGFTDKVVTIEMLQETLRIVSIRADDSPVVVCNIIPEDSAEGRKQLNSYVRGVYDDPRVVLAKVWSGDHLPILKYYSSEKDECPTFELEYIPYPVVSNGSVWISPRLEYAVLNELAAMVLDSLNEHEKAGIYKAKAKEYISL